MQKGVLICCGMGSSRKRVCWILAGMLSSLLVLQSLFAAPSSAGLQFYAMGTSDFSEYYRSGRPPYHETINYYLIVSNSNWHLTLAPQDTNQSKFDYITISCDGTNLYGIKYFPTAIEQRIRTHPGLKPGFNNATALIYKGHIPHWPTAHWAGPIWLAYASSGHFKGGIDELAEPVISFAVSGVIYSATSRFQQRSRWVPQKMEPFLPLRVDYYSDGIRRPPWTNTVSRRKVYDTPYLNASYRVLASTNVSSFSFPSLAVMVVLQPDIRGDHPENVFTNHEYLIRLTSLTLDIPSTDFIPPLSLKTIVSDARLPDKTLLYPSRGTNWLSEKEATNINMSKDHRLRATRTRQRWIIIALVLLSLLPIVILQYRSRITHIYNNNNNI